MWLEILQTFIDENDAFFFGERRFVDEELAAIYIRNGWAREVSKSLQLMNPFQQSNLH